MDSRAQHLRLKIVLSAIGLCLVAGCAEWTSRAERVDAHFGEAVREMRVAQTFNADKRAHPNPNPIMLRDGKKAQQVLDTTYRKDVWEPELKRKDRDINIFGKGQ